MRKVEKLPDVVWLKYQADEIKRLAQELGKEKAYTQELEHQITEFKKWQAKFKKNIQWEARVELAKKMEFTRLKRINRELRKSNKILKQELITLKLNTNSAMTSTN